SAALNVVVAKPVAQDVRTYRLAAVILDLSVLLVGLLRCQEVGPGAERIDTPSQADGVRSNRETDLRKGIENAALRGIGNQVAELHVAKTHLVRISTRAEIQSNLMDGRVVHIGKGRPPPRWGLQWSLECCPSPRLIGPTERLGYITTEPP